MDQEINEEGHLIERAFYAKMEAFEEANTARQNALDNIEATFEAVLEHHYRCLREKLEAQEFVIVEDSDGISFEFDLLSQTISFRVKNRAETMITDPDPIQTVVGYPCKAHCFKEIVLVVQEFNLYR